MNSKKLNPKKLIIIIICAVVIVISSIVILLYTKAPKPYETFETYKENFWVKQVLLN